MTAGGDVNVVGLIREGGIIKFRKAKRLRCELLQDILVDAAVAAGVGRGAGEEVILFTCGSRPGRLRLYNGVN